MAHLFRWLLALICILGLISTAPPAVAAGPPPAMAGLTLAGAAGEPLVVRSPGRFALAFAEGELAAWYDLRRDPAATANLAIDGGPLLALAVAGAPLPAGELAVREQSPVRIVLERTGLAGTPPAPFRLRYSVWAGGQVDLSWSGPAPLATSLRHAADAITGAAMSAAPARVEGGSFQQELSLFLDAWTGEPRQGALLAPDGVIRAEATGPRELVLPAGLALRAPRFELSGWPGPELTLRRGATVLVAGQDYLAHYDPAAATLVAQYLHPLPAAPAGAEERFSFTPAQTPALSLGIVGRTLDENGLLVVDGNLPNGDGDLTAPDLFSIPYIQSTNQLTVSATFQGPGAGVELVLTGGGLANPVLKRALGQPGAPLLVPFTLPTKGEYRLEGYLLSAAGVRLGSTPDDTIAPLGYGRVVVTIGDSITAGVRGDAVAPGDSTFPVSVAARSPVASADGRNFFQYDNSSVSAASFYRSYQVTLNDRIAQCSGGPVFVLNSGIRGLRTRPQSGSDPRPADEFAYTKLSAYLDQIQRLGARYVFIALGTNDVSDARDPATWANEGIGGLIARLQAGAPGVRIWVPTIPYRNDDTSPSKPRLNRTRQFNAALPAALAATNTSLNPVYSGPDLFAHFETNQGQLSADNLHPTQAGYEAMAQLWAGAGSSTSLCGVMQAEPPDPPLPPEPPLERVFRILIPPILRGAP